MKLSSSPEAGTMAVTLPKGFPFSPWSRSSSGPAATAVAESVAFDHAVEPSPTARA
ncbi:hypothetical protein [Streptomyces sp. CBMA152]|uniref:hypothetical protein n=1 Tax=Streptomyces sp. CBMA152 TaxID=1896312 RepID=UPI001CB757ED|nr:hypothetical protein [Streptomyces sp. CBMA152]